MAKKTLTMGTKQIIVKQLKDLKGNPENPRKISAEQLEMLQKSLEEFGDLSGFVYNTRTNQLIGAHQRAQVSPKDSQVYIDRRFDAPTKTGTVAEGYIEINGERHKYREVDVDPQREKAMNIAANKHGGEFDMPKLTEWLHELDAHNYDLGVVGFSAEELDGIMAPTSGAAPSAEEARAKLKDKFLVPPFTVLNAREGAWQDRKRAWIALGIKSEIGRGGAPTGGSPEPLSRYKAGMATTWQPHGNQSLGAIPSNQNDLLGKGGKYR
jgi:hypothetical protein